MAEILLLDQNTIDKIAAGEVVERPSSVVKELVENAIDAGATAISVEIKEGGLSLIRVTDNGAGIEKSQVKKAFLRHSTSKIRTAEDLFGVKSLGFRGEALSSISAVAQVELITKTKESLTGVRYIIEGGEEKSMEEIGAPEGTTLLVRNLFYNTPARRKFLKSAQTEGSYVGELLEKLALSNPQISFQLLLNGRERMHSSGNGNLKDLIYHIYGRETALNLVEIHRSFEGFTIDGFLGKPVISRGNRAYEHYYINGRYVKSKLIAKAIEDGYDSFMMQHRYPFVVLHLGVEGHHLDVNVHPTKMELRFDNQQTLYNLLADSIKLAMLKGDLIPEVTFEKTAQEKKEEAAAIKVKEQERKSMPQPFEKKRMEQFKIEEEASYKKDEQYIEKPKATEGEPQKPHIEKPKAVEGEPKKPHFEKPKAAEEAGTAGAQADKDKLAEEKPKQQKPEQLELFSEKLLDVNSVPRHRIIGQLFKTYWLVEFDNQFYMIDQHAAHEKVLFERFMKNLREKQITSQYISPPMVLSLSAKEEEMLLQYEEYFAQMGFEIANFGGREYTVSAVPANLYGLAGEGLFFEILDGLAEESRRIEDTAIVEKLASMSCKAAVKGNMELSYREAETLIGELLTLENPYHCPHGRPTIVTMSKQEIERKFKRII